jgi:hypothetical protein
VPGIFFDLNPSRRRDLFDSPCHHFVRLSYGPRMDVLKMGLDGIERVVNKSVFSGYNTIDPVLIVSQVQAIWINLSKNKINKPTCLSYCLNIDGLNIVTSSPVLQVRLVALASIP